MRYAILIENNKVIVEFSERDFKTLLKYNYEQTKDIDTAFDRTKQQLGNKVRTI